MYLDGTQNDEVGAWFGILLPRLTRFGVRVSLSAPLRLEEELAISWALCFWFDCFELT